MVRRVRVVEAQEEENGVWRERGSQVCPIYEVRGLLGRIQKQRGELGRKGLWKK